MNFAENNRISHRQLYRQVVLAFLAPFLLCLPGRGRILGVNGLAGTVAALAALLFYAVFLIRLGPCCTDLKKCAGGFSGRITGVFFLVYVILAAAYLLALLEEIVPVSLVAGVSGKWISFFALLGCSMGAHKGMQRRGRMAEVSGGILLVGILAMMILCVGQGKPEYLSEMIAESRLSGSGFLRSVYGVLCGFSGIGLLPFTLEHVEKKQKGTGKTLCGVILTLGGILLTMELLLPAVFGWERLKIEEFPVLPLLAGANLPGNVLARFDVVWMGFLLYSLLFSIGSLLHYGHQVIGKAHLGTGRIWMAAVIYFLSLAEFGGVGVEDYFGWYVAWVFLPGMLLLQAFLFAKSRGRWKKKMGACAASAAVLCFCLLLGGCAGVEPEKRMYPLALGVDRVGDDFLVTYGMPDLPEATGQNKTGDEGSRALAVLGRDFGAVEAAYNRSQEKYLDMGHLQILILGNEALKGNSWETVLEYLKQEPFVGENVHVFRTADAQQALNWSGSQGTSVGEYVQGLLENRSMGQQKQGVTLRDVYHEWYQYGRLHFLPEIRVGESVLEVLWE